MLGVFLQQDRGWNKSFGMVTWESKYDVGRPETCKDPKNISDEAILCTFFKVFDYNIIFWFSILSNPKSLEKIKTAFEEIALQPHRF